MKLPSINWKRLLKLLGPLLFIFFFIRIVDPVKTAALIKNINPVLVLFSMILFPCLMYLRTLRWWLICRQIDLKTPLKRLFQINYISWFLGNLPIGGISAVSKVVYLKEEGSQADRAFISITLDKLFDIIGLLVFGVYALFYFPSSLIAEKIPWIFFIVITLFAVGLVVFSKKIWGMGKQLLNKYLNKKLRRIGSNMENDLKLFWSRFGLGLFLRITGLSISLGILRSLALYILAHAIGISVTFGFMIACRGLIGIANIIPISISGLGIRDAILLLTLPLIGYSREAALALGLTVFLWTTIFKFSGIYYWLKGPLPLSTIAAIKDKFFS